MDFSSLKTTLQPNGSIVLAVKVVPRSNQNLIQDIREGVLVVRLSAPPVEGKANAALVAYFAEVFGLRKNQIGLRTGEKSRHKLVELSGTTVEAIINCIRVQAYSAKSPKC